MFSLVWFLTGIIVGFLILILICITYDEKQVIKMDNSEVQKKYK